MWISYLILLTVVAVNAGRVKQVYYTNELIFFFSRIAEFEIPSQVNDNRSLKDYFLKVWVQIA